MSDSVLLKTLPRIPSIIYTFWEGDLTVIADLCIKLMGRMNPHWRVVVLDSTYLLERPSGYDALSVQAKSDWARTSMIAETGGVWLDATCIMLRPIESWVDVNSEALHAFLVPFGCDVAESWAFAAPSNCLLVQRWRDEFRNAIVGGFKMFNRTHDIPECLTNRLPYLTIHQALHVARQELPNEPVHLLPSTSDEGPYGIAERCKWDNSKIVHALSLLNLDQLSMPFIKLNGQMTKKIKFDLSAKPVGHIEKLLGAKFVKKRNILKFIVIVVCITVCFFVLKLIL